MAPGPWPLLHGSWTISPWLMAHGPWHEWPRMEMAIAAMVPTVRTEPKWPCSLVASLAGAHCLSNSLGFCGAFVFRRQPMACGPCGGSCGSLAVTLEAHGHAPHGAWPVAPGPWPLPHGPWPMAHGSWPMAHGPWLVAHWPMAHGPWPMACMATDGNGHGRYGAYGANRAEVAILACGPACGGSLLRQQPWLLRGLFVYATVHGLWPWRWLLWWPCGDA